MDFSYEAITSLKNTHPAIRLLAADHAPLILSFFHTAFSLHNARSMSESLAIRRLDDHLHDLSRVHGPEQFPKSARAYLDTWASADFGFLRKSLPAGRDEPEYDLTPESELALEWLIGLVPRPFIGTESRLGTLFDLLRQLAAQAAADPASRLAILNRRKAEIDAEILAVEAGTGSELSEVQIRERYLEISDLARHLLADFRQIEHNFRQLDRQARQRIAQFHGSRGALLDEIFGEQDVINDSEQGQSFRAFWHLLMSPDRQTELAELLAEVESLAAEIRDQESTGIDRFRLNLAEAGDRVQGTLAGLSAQLRRFLDDQAWLENRRMMELIRTIETLWIQAPELADERQQSQVDSLSPDINLPLERPLFEPPVKIDVDSSRINLGEADIDADALFNQFFVDAERIRDNIWKALQNHEQIDLQMLLQQYPIRQGLPEVIGYLTIASSDERALINPDCRCEIIWQHHDRWQKAELPQIIFMR